MPDSSLRRILLIDDEEGIRKVMAIDLRDAGYTVWTAASGEEGLEIFSREKPAIVLTDIKMPGMDGIEVLRRIKASDPETEVIIITGHGEMEIAIRALQLESSDFITKPIHDEALAIALKRAEEKIALKQQLRDYTENLECRVREATAEIKRISDFQASLINNSLDGIVAADQGGTIVIFNASAQRLTGYGETEVAGRLCLSDLYGAELAERWLRCGSREFLPDGDLHLDTTIRNRSGDSIPVRLTGVTLRKETEVLGCVTFFQDLRRIRQLEQQLIQSERLAATGQSVASMAHAIKNIVSGLKGGMFVVNKGFELANQEYLHNGWDMVQRNIAKVSTLAMDLLTYSKERRPEYRMVHPQEVAREVVELLRTRAQEFGVQVVLETDEDIEPLAMDASGIHQCLVNLVGNGIDASRPEICGHEMGRVTLRVCRQSGWAVCFQVEDNGCGIGEEDRENLFTTFFSTKGAEGTGLGLLNVQKIVAEHKGRVQVQSEVGRGSVFCVLLPEGLAREQDDEGGSANREHENPESCLAQGRRGGRVV
ncbi:MAG TPA: response regulator [Syntrophobacteria bacterium]|nr:response regulator [Syntrophobacteria bacterium]